MNSNHFGDSSFKGASIFDPLDESLLCVYKSSPRCRDCQEYQDWDCHDSQDWDCQDCQDWDCHDSQNCQDWDCQVCTYPLHVKGRIEPVTTVSYETGIETTTSFVEYAGGIKRVQTYYDPYSNEDDNGSEVDGYSSEEYERESSEQIAVVAEIGEKTEADFYNDDLVQNFQEFHKHLLALPVCERTSHEVFWDRTHEKFVPFGLKLTSKKVMWMGKIETVYKAVSICEEPLFRNRTTSK